MEVIQQLYQTAVAHHQAGRLQDAEQIYRQILTNNPDQPDTLHLLGVIAHQAGEHAAAIKHIQRAIRLKGDDSSFHNNLGNVFAAQGKYEEAAGCFRRALELKPDNSSAKSNLANAFKELGNGLKDRGRIEEAIACYQQTLAILPESTDAWNNLGIVLADRGEFDAAISCYHRALNLNPNLSFAHYNLGNALNGRGKPNEAVVCLRRAYELQPDCVPILDQLIRSLQQLCLWHELGPLMARAITTVCETESDSVNNSMPPFAFLTMSAVTTSEQQHRCASRWVANVVSPVAQAPRHTKTPGETAANQKIRIGYLSADFRSHPVADLIVEMLELHDRSQFWVVAYSIGPDDGSPVRQRIMKAVDEFVDLKTASFEESASRIAEDGIDILVDLMGFTQHSRTKILALKPAPIQVNYLGYTGTMGAPFIDYILVDDVVVPSDRQPFYSEKLVHLPGCYQVSDRQRTISSVTPKRSDCGLPEAAFVFCSFNHHHKITPEVFDIWMDLLKEVPNAVLWLPEGNRVAPQNLQREAEKRSVSADRLVFAPRLPSFSDHLARYRIADLFLDTFPFNAHTTANDALWAGCPVLTLSGETFVSRVAGSLLRSVGLPELITTNFKDYHDLALSLARDPDRLRELRVRLEANRQTSLLYDTPRITKNIENAFITMQALRNRGKQPRPFEVGG